ncbi:hypothetical protein G4X40_19735 [Rhodococcus sp. D2-41]|uniref:fibronectin type III domain-containing protein n=1 Tax=Speluncibacter jeojiensis TaxID=2710754 RepID=UPI00240FE1CD|nr:hypothetical protein [Rhodococcus sp. D2-41]MDG3012375.1 hypothetical protein [Rhodococcus sp. D2-41]
MSGYATWDNLFVGDSTRDLKAQYGMVLVRDWNAAATSLASYSPFDPVTGNLSPTLLTTDGWYNPGYLDATGVVFTPKFTVVDDDAWQTRQALRTDVTLDQEEMTFVPKEQSPLVDALRFQDALSSLQEQGAAGYQLTKSTRPSLANRQILAIGVDYNTGQPEYFAFEYAMARMVKPDKISFDAKNTTASGLTFDSYVCPYSGFAVRFFREGPAWRASGGNTTVPGNPTAATGTATGTVTLTFTPPTSANGPFTYQVNTVTPTAGAVPAANVTVTSATSSQVVLTVGALTSSTSYTFTVQATGANDSQSVPSAVSSAAAAK